MKANKMIIAALASTLIGGSAFAQEQTPVKEAPVAVALLPTYEHPAADRDILGFRFGFLASEHHNVSLLDINLLAAFTTGEQLGLQLSGIYNSIGHGAGALQLGGFANECRSNFIGGQISAFYNRTQGTVSGLSIGSLNLTDNLHGLQIGILNRVKNLEGLQIGIVNYANEAEGLQIGIVNVMREGEWPVLPVINYGF